MIRPAFKFISQCQACELVRYTDEEMTHWALVGERDDGLLMLLVIPSNGTLRCENVMGPMDHPLAVFERNPVLTYGREYSIVVDHAGHCEIGGTGELIRAPGAYVMGAENDSLCCRDGRNPSKPGYYDLDTGRVRSEPGGVRAAFARWELALSPEGAPPTRLLVGQANKPPVVVPFLASGPAAASRFDQPGG